MSISTDLSFKKSFFHLFIAAILSFSLSLDSIADPVPSVTSPTAESTLGGSIQEFSWDYNGLAVEQWALYVGSTVGGYEHAVVGAVDNATSRTVYGLPADGSTLYVRLWYRVGSLWGSIDSIYTALTPPTPPQMSSPTPGSTLTGSSQTFSWDYNGLSAEQWALYVGSTVGGYEHAVVGALDNATSRTVYGLPADGSTLYVRLWYRVGSVWESIDSTYTALTPPTPPQMSSPTPGSTLGGSSQEFSWDYNGLSVEQWALYVGSTVGGYEHAVVGALDNATSRTVYGLPSDGSTLYLRLWYRVGSSWGYVDETYTAFTSAPADTTPPVITLNGDNPYSVTIDTAYTDPGATALDDVDGVVNVTIDTSQVDMTTAGSYQVTYTATDMAGNLATEMRTVNVSSSSTFAGLIGHWKLDEGTGAIAQDESGNGINLNLNNTSNANWVTGHSGTAVSFDGANQDASTASATALQKPSVTFSAWINPNQSSTFWEWIAAQGDNVGLYFTPGDRRVYFYMKDTSGGWIAVSSGSNSIEFNQWQHVAGSFDAATHTMKVYVNGNEVGSLNSAQGIQYDAGNGFTIGSMQAARYFDGSIDEVQIYDNALTNTQINELAQGGGLTPPPPPPGGGSTVKIYPLGDSITDSINGRPSYRRPLWFSLQNAGYDVDFVGSWTRNESSYTDYDLDHDGHSGAEAGDIDSNVNNYLSGIDPDIVLLHIGTNDLDRGQTDASTLNEIDSIIQKLRAKNPSMVIFLAKIIPMRNYDTAGFNAQIDGFVASRTTAVSPIIVVDQYSGFDAQADNYDNWHPNESGENKMADKWFQALQNYL